MFILFGKRAFGEVDRVAEVGSVSTRFFHVWYFPLIPLGSYLFPTGHSNHGIPVPLNVKSMLVAWARAVAVAVMVVGVIAAIVAYGDREYNAVWTWLIAVSVAFFVFDLSRSWRGLGKASDDRESEMRSLLASGKPRRIEQRRAA